MDVTSNLMRKVGDDVSRATARVLAIAPDHPALPIALAGVAAALGAATAVLQKISGTDMKEASDANIMLAALLGARFAMESRNSDEATDAAYRDLEVLKENGRIEF